MQVFGEDDVEKVIFVAVPNHGLSGSAEKYCSFLGASAECRDMLSSSVLINKLNTGSGLNVPAYNIIGLGCNTDGQQGDGIVTNSSAYLDGAQNIYAEGSCTSLDFFHSNIIDPYKYPEVYNIIKQNIR